MSNAPYPTAGWGAQPPLQQVPPYEPPMPPYGAPPQQPYGVPPQQPYGVPPQQPYGAPPQQPYGVPPQQPYGAPPQQPYGAPPMPPYGAPPQQPYGGLPDAERYQQFTARGFSDKSVRRGFIRKVYLILAAQLLVTTAVVCAFTFVPAVREWVRVHRWVYYVSYAVFLVTYIAISCCVNCRRRYPTNIITLAIFTLALSYMTGTLAAYHGAEAVVIALAMTVALCLALTLFALQTKIDFTMCYGLIFALGMVLILTGLASLIVYLVMGPSRVMQAVYAGVALVFFSIMLIYDTQQVVGGRRHELEPEEYVFGAMQIYVDIVYIFMMLLSLIGVSKD